MDLDSGTPGNPERGETTRIEPPGTVSRRRFLGRAAVASAGIAVASAGVAVVGQSEARRATKQLAAAALYSFSYVYLAEHAGAEIHADSKVVDVEHTADGGYRLTVERPGAWLQKDSRTYTADQVVLSAGVLGTLKLLFRLKDRGGLSAPIARLGQLARTNSETILGATAGSSRPRVRFWCRNHVVDPPGRGHAHRAGALPQGQQPDGAPRHPPGRWRGRISRPVRFLGEVLRHPVAFLRTLGVYRWSERTVLLLVMQSRDNSIRIRPRRWGGLTSDQGAEPSPTSIPRRTWSPG